MKKEVLLVHPYNLHRGGSEIFLSEWIKFAPPGQYNFTWYCLGEIQDDNFLNEIETYVDKFIEGDLRKSCKAKKFFRLYRDLNSLMKQHHFDVIHINGGQTPIALFTNAIALTNGIPVRIAHSHSSPVLNKLKKFIFMILKPQLRKITTKCAACSTEAGISMFGAKVLNSSKFMLIQNTIDTQIFMFDEMIRNQFRKKARIEDKIVLGCVGNPDENKNQILALQLVKELKEQGVNHVKLLLIGSGPLDQELRNEAGKLGIAEEVRFLGVSNCVEKWLQAMDIFLMPSKSEGLGIAALEAQTAGLPCILSDKMPKAVKVSDYVKFVSIDDVGTWISAVREFMQMDYDRSDVSQSVCQTGIDISYIPQYINSLYEP